MEAFARLRLSLVCLCFVLAVVVADGPAVTALNYHVKSYQTLEERNEMAVVTGKHHIRQTFLPLSAIGSPTLGGRLHVLNMNVYLYYNYNFRKSIDLLLMIQFGRVHILISTFALYLQAQSLYLPVVGNNNDDLYFISFDIIRKMGLISRIERHLISIA